MDAQQPSFDAAKYKNAQREQWNKDGAAWRCWNPRSGALVWRSHAPDARPGQDHKVGVVHYAYSATVEPRAGAPLDVTGKWAEVYLKQGDRWTMVAVSW